MTKKFGMIIGVTVAMMAASGSVAAIGANGNQEIQQAKSTVAVKKGQQLDTRQTAEKAARQAGQAAVKSQNAQATFEQGVVNNNQNQDQKQAPIQNVSNNGTTKLSATTQPATKSVSDNKAVEQATVKAPVATTPSTDVNTVDQVKQNTTPVVATDTNTDDQNSQVPAVEPRDDAQGQATKAAMEYARQNGINLSGLQVGTTPADEGGYNVIIRDKHIAEQGKGDGVEHSYYVDENGKIVSNKIN